MIFTFFGKLIFTITSPSFLFGVQYFLSFCESDSCESTQRLLIFFGCENVNELISVSFELSSLEVLSPLCLLFGCENNLTPGVLVTVIYLTFAGGRLELTIFDLFTFETSKFEMSCFNGSITGSGSITGFFCLTCGVEHNRGLK
jgi:hypothetical protein